MRVLLGVACTIGVLFIYIMGLVITEMLTHRQCLRYGYRSASVDILYTQYCIKRVNQTDVVTPLNELGDKP